MPTVVLAWVFESDSIAEELLNLLSKFPELRVTSRQSAFSFKGKDVLLADVARQLLAPARLDDIEFDVKGPWCQYSR